MGSVVSILQSAGIVLAAAAGLFVLEALIAVFAPWIRAPKQALTGPAAGDRGSNHRREIEFEVDGSVVRGWLYLPEPLESKVPCVVMTNGFGGTKEVILPRYAERFRAENMAVLVFDPRHFGESDGEPRQLYSPALQVEDARAAVAFARSHPSIDPDRIALWGTSASGGLGLVIAAADPRIRCIVGQTPSFDSNADLRKALADNGLWFIMRLFVHAQRDKGRSRLNMAPHLIPIVGRPGTLAFHNVEGAYEGYSRIAAGVQSFRNETCARVLLNRDNIQPIAYAERVTCPALFFICEHDNLVEMESYKQVAEKMGDRVGFTFLSCGHFDIYFDEYFEQAVREQIEFLKHELFS
jgi:hypothetical protein